MPTKSKARTAAAAVAGKNGHSLISSGKFRQLYAALVKYELLQERLGESLGLSPSCADGAAGAVGITLDLDRGDTVVLNAQTFAANLVKGVPLRALLHHRNSNDATFFGEVNALTPSEPSAVSQAGLATGTALANKMAGNRKIAVAFIDGGAAALAECKEALQLASANNLPVIYVIHANQDRKLAGVLSELEEMTPVITVDAHDVVAVYRVAQESIARARDGGPSLIVCVPYPSNSADQSATVSMERYLTGKKLFRNRWKDRALAEFDREVSAACLPSANPLA
jgi:TPP-dependent pyruvate/acetoin dehydrogenase alpha subunit